MRWLGAGLVTLLVVAGALFACAPTEAGHWTCSEDDCKDDSPQKTSKRPASSGQSLGEPMAALPEDQEQPPETAPKSTPAPQTQNGGTVRHEGAEAGSPPDVIDDDAGTWPTPPPPPPSSVLDASNACWSGTLNAFVELNGCYQRQSDAMWFQCHLDTASQSNLWFRNVVDGVGPFGPCTSVHPLP
jgi:hypothetical protein